MTSYFNKIKEIKTGLDEPRSGWKIRGVEEEIAETVWQHTKKVKKATSIYIRHFPDLDALRAVKMATYHDVAEHKEEDYVPGQISEEEKHLREKVVIEELRDYFGEAGGEFFDIWMEYEQEETKEAKLVKQLDKLDATIQAMEYEKRGYDNMTDFYDYPLPKLSDPVLKNILQILLKKEYLTIDTYEQYFMLLECKGDEEIFRERMRRDGGLNN